MKSNGENKRRNIEIINNGERKYQNDNGENDKLILTISKANEISMKEMTKERRRKKMTKKKESNGGEKWRKENEHEKKKKRKSVSKIMA